jgi:hypothetical protein
MMSCPTKNIVATRQNMKAISGTPTRPRRRHESLDATRREPELLQLGGNYLVQFGETTGGTFIMAKKTILIALAVCAFGFVSAPQSNAGTDTVIDNSAAAPPPSDSYAPPPPVYYAPAPVRFAVYPTFGYYARPVRFYGYHPFHGRHIYERRHWR